MTKYLKRITVILGMVMFEAKALAKSVLTELKVQKDRKRLKGARLEIGSGFGRKQGFVTLDLHRQTDYPYDLRLGLPFADDCFSLIYSEHTLEHFSRDELVFVLQECRRVLQRGGRFSLAVPRVSLLLRGYSLTDDQFQEAITYDYPNDLRARLDIINYMFYMNGEHRNSFDEENLRMALEQVGFREIRMREFDPLLDLEVRKTGSMYFDCVK